MIVEAIALSAAVVVTGSLVFARKMMNDERSDELQERQRQERLQIDQRQERLRVEKERRQNDFSGVPIIASIHPVTTCPYCNANNAKAEKRPRGEYLLERRGDRAELANVPWGTEVIHGPSTATVVVAAGQRIWQMCSFCFAEWLCNKPAAGPQIDSKPPKKA